MASDAHTASYVTASYSDGASAATTTVEVRLAHEGVAFHSSGLPLVTWPYNTLTSSEPISRHSDDVLLGSTDHPDATLFVANAAFTQRLKERAPSLSTGATRKREAMPWVWATLAVLAIAAGIWASGFSPSRTLAGMLPETARQQLGNSITASLSKDAKSCATPAGQRALDKIKQRLLRSANTDQTFSISVLDWNVLNAFAAPGGRIILTRKIIEKASGGDEIAGILAHEIGHGLELHPEAGLIRGMGMIAAVQFMLGGGNSNMASIGILLAQLSYSREAEREADAHAVKLMTDAKVSLTGLKSFFRRMNKQKNAKPSTARRSVNILRSHPVTEERIKQFDAAPTYEATPVLSEAEWAALKSICGEQKSKRAPKEPPDLDPGKEI